MSTHPTTSTASSEPEPLGINLSVDEEAKHTVIGEVPAESVMDAYHLNVFYGDFHAVHDVNLPSARTRSLR